MRPKLRTSVLVWLAVALVNTACAQTVAVQGDHFTVNGRAQFLIFASYFDGIRRPTATLDNDLDYLKSKGVNGIRVLPNWNAQLMNANGELNGSALSRLLTLVDHAAARGLIVDVTFTRDTICGNPDSPRCAFTVDAYKWGPGSQPNGSDHHGGIKGTTEALIGKANVMFDLQNEWSLHGITAVQLQDIKDHAVKSVDPLRLVTASTSPPDGESNTASFVKSHGFDILAYHDPRYANGEWAPNTRDVVNRLHADLAQSPAKILPVYLQEPNRFPAAHPCSECDSTEAHYETAVQNAKSAGAGAWTFHNDPNKDLSGTTSFHDLLEPGEQTFLDHLITASNVTWSGGSREHAPSQGKPDS